MPLFFEHLGSLFFKLLLNFPDAFDINFYKVFLFSNRLSGVVVPILLTVQEVRRSTPGLTTSATHLLV